jgi:hypothetical protein
VKQEAATSTIYQLKSVLKKQLLFFQDTNMKQTHGNIPALIWK